MLARSKLNSRKITISKALTNNDLAIATIQQIIDEEM